MEQKNLKTVTRNRTIGLMTGSKSSQRRNTTIHNIYPLFTKTMSTTRSNLKYCKKKKGKKKEKD